MPTKAELQNQLEDLQATIRDTITLLQEQIPEPDYTLIRQLHWNRGWAPDGTFTDTILDDPYYDEQALLFTIKVLQNTLDPTT
ncbi:unnamed protein product [marine sediment metagenome]|uniref:Uncharacterized protein n=1 Tax=marine sediment metagenome TaxID=412755 RepID=X1FLE1_9ZZZZ